VYACTGEALTVDVDPSAENLTYTTTLFDAVLCWDIPDYLPEAVVRPAVERLLRVTKTGGVLLSFFHTRDAGPDAPYYRYHIVGDDQLELQQGPRFRLQRIFNNPTSALPISSSILSPTQRGKRRLHEPTQLSADRGRATGQRATGGVRSSLATGARNAPGT
jgi:hypothetical protein